ncbi:cation-translocating P-type ATPase [Chitinophaga rhizosphaerae]|uniref:cation-translocating P-type ATPase n=1 Tax=Chitinophaga rhizosphaerae TaxID=1864947 RepID=UPI000F812585|nr:cation-translocating P-type ATPase [Chitinophaga rhizosphaerae]
MKQTPQTDQFTGLSATEAESRLRQYGKNVFRVKQVPRFLLIIWNMVREPMFLLLLTACLLYFILGSVSEGLLMLAAILLVSAIEFFEEARSNKAMKALQAFTAPRARVLRDGKLQETDTENIVPGDILVLSEGDLVPADATLLLANDFSVNESVITGESMPAARVADQSVFRGTQVNTGQAVAKVTATGNATELGKLGIKVSETSNPETIIQRQTWRYVKRLAIFGFLAFVLVCVLNYIQTNSWAESLLMGLTLAMAAIPEEIPVAFSSFMALGALYMSRRGIIPRQPQVIENLGAVNVLCLDKTGTITENVMRVADVYGENALQFAALASEKHPFDSMEKAILDRWGKPLPDMVHEYPLGGHPPMMTHVYNLDGVITATAKGAVERIVRVCKLNAARAAEVTAYADGMAAKGFRVLGVASAIHAGGAFPEEQDGFDWRFEGLVSLQDPPRKNAREVIGALYAAGIDVKLITGDYLATARYIASEVGIRNLDHAESGESVMAMTEAELKEKVKTVNLFVRMFPDAKVKVVEALKSIGDITAMTGDGVNDGPALKTAHIGIAMGKKGADIARMAADLVITDDNLDRILIAIQQGRKIFTNLRKAIRYIISIHIPIIFTATLPLLLGWAYPNIFTPIHVIFLELIMGPTCSIFYEREPAEENLMERPSRGSNMSLFRGNELWVSVAQGLAIAAGVLGLYRYYMPSHSLEETRTVVFTTLVMANIFLTFADRSFSEHFFHTVRYRNNLVPLVLGASILFLCIIHFVPAVRVLFGMTRIPLQDGFLCLGVSFASVVWFEAYKAIRGPKKTG